MAQVLVVVARGRESLSERLAQTFAGIPDVAVILDRRRRERRQRSRPREPERRRRPGIDNDLRSSGFAIVRLGPEGA